MTQDLTINAAWALIARFLSPITRQLAGAQRHCGGFGGQRHRGHRNSGGFSARTHVLTDAHGLPIAVYLTRGQMADVSGAVTLLASARQRPHELLADIADDTDTDTVCAERHLHVAHLIIPRGANCKSPRTLDRLRYAKRNHIGRVMDFAPWFRRVATRYGKPASASSTSPRSLAGWVLSTRPRFDHRAAAPENHWWFGAPDLGKALWVPILSVGHLPIFSVGVSDLRCTSATPDPLPAVALSGLRCGHGAVHGGGLCLLTDTTACAARHARYVSDNNN
ncbi:MAG: transposase [Paracoccaceae bacterium]|jgi:transposase